MATQEQLDNAEEFVRDAFPDELAKVVIADQDGTNPFGALAYKLSVVAFNQGDPVEVLEEFLQRANDSPAAYVASRIEY